MAYQIAAQSSKEDKLLLWLVVVGVTHRYVNGDISRLAYESFVHEYSSRVLDVKEEPKHILLSDPSDRGPHEAILPILEGLSIDFVEEDVDLMLYRHWSLADALRFSDATAGSLGAWNSDESEIRLKNFLAQMGIPLKQAHQKFTLMPNETRLALPAKLRAHSAQYNLGDLSFPSFVLRNGYGSKIAAADLSYAATALLEVSLFFKIRTTKKYWFCSLQEKKLTRLCDRVDTTYTMPTPAGLSMNGSTMRMMCLTLRGTARPWRVEFSSPRNCKRQL